MDDELELSCPYCDHEFLIPDTGWDLLGKEITCSKCGEAGVIEDDYVSIGNHHFYLDIKG